MDKFVTRIHLLTTLVAVIIAIPVFAFTTFVTLRERDILKSANETRMIRLENHYDELMAEVQKMSGKVDTLILLQK